MPRLAPDGTFPGLRGLVARALLGLLDRDEIRAEIGRQLDRFELGCAPRPTTSTGTSTCMCCRACGRRCSRRAAAISEPPAADPRSVRPAGRRHRARRRRAQGCRGGRSGAGLRRAPRANRACRPTTALPASPTSTSATPYATELQSALSQPGRRHIVMCHPGPSRRRACRPRPGRRAAAHGVRRADARSGPAGAHLAAFAQRRRPAARLGGPAGLSDGMRRTGTAWPRRPASGPARAGLSGLGRGRVCRRRAGARAADGRARHASDRGAVRRHLACHGRRLADAPHLHVRRADAAERG